MSGERLTLLEQALDLASRGLSVIPIPARAKVPAIAWRPYQQRHATATELRAWFAGGAPMNLAIVTGQISGIVAIDLDTEAAARWWVRHRPYSPWQVRTARGWHLYYRSPGTSIGNRARLETPHGRLAIDVRGDGGYVIGPGSVHASGARYARAGCWEDPITAVPALWPGWLARPTRPPEPRPETPRLSGDVVDRARRYLAAIPRPEIGQGSDRDVLYAACRLTRGYALDAHTAAALLWDWCGARPGWTREWIERKVRHAARYGTEPIGGLRA